MPLRVSLASVLLALPPIAQSQVAPWMNPALAPERRAVRLVRAMTLPEKFEQLVGSPGVVPELPQCYGARHVNGIPRLLIPTFRITNGPVGVGQNDCVPLDTPNLPRGAQGSRESARATQLPSAMAVAASFDRGVARQFGDVIGTEARDLALDVVEGPGLNLARVPQAGRNFEYFGEDPYLTGTMASAEIQAIQRHGVIAMAKHFVANEQETNRFTVNETVDDRVLHELYFLPFEMAVKDGRVASVMCSYNMVDGSYACQDEYNLTNVLRTQWGFTGYVQTDFTALHATAAAMRAGVDHEMPGIHVSTPSGSRFGPWWAPDSLRSALDRGEISETDIDTALLRRYAVMFALGIFDRPIVQSVIDTVRDGAIARSIGEQSAVLLKNVGRFLPLDPQRVRSIALIGQAEYASKAVAGCCGGSSDVIPLYSVAPLDGMRHTLARLGSRAATTLTIVANDNANLTSAVAAARGAEIAVVLAGTIADEGRDRPSIMLSNGQDSLIAAVAAANPRTIVVLKDNASTVMPWIDRVPAVLEAWFPGEEDGNIVADLLFGEATPSGRLPVTFPRREADLPAISPDRWPGLDASGRPVSAATPSDVPTKVAYSEGLDIGYRWFDARNMQPLFPFGYGLSYTTFDISQVEITPSAADGIQPIDVWLTVTNTGDRRGAEVPQVYVALPTALGEPPKRLVGFEKVWLNPGESRRVRIVIDPRAANHPLAHWLSDRQTWVTSSGNYNVLVGRSSRDILSQRTIEIRARERR